jgi:hypothetical protein
VARRANIGRKAIGFRMTLVVKLSWEVRSAHIETDKVEVAEEARIVRMTRIPRVAEETEVARNASMEEMARVGKVAEVARNSSVEEVAGVVSKMAILMFNDKEN